MGDPTSDSDCRTPRERWHTDVVTAADVAGASVTTLYPWGPAPAQHVEKSSYSLDQPSGRDRCVF